MGFGELKNGNLQPVKLFIVSFGLKEAFHPHLEKVGLLPFFEGVYGADCDDYWTAADAWGIDRRSKAALIKEVIMKPRGYNFDDVLFVDDSQNHLDAVSENDVCRTMMVRSMSYHLPEIYEGEGVKAMKGWNTMRFVQRPIHVKYNLLFYKLQ